MIPYAVTPDFENWVFREEDVPKPWFYESFESAETALCTDQFRPTVSRGHCVLTGASTREGVQTIPLTGDTISNVAHLIPLSCGLWFQRNGMNRFSWDPCNTAGPDISNNICHLRSDLLADFNRCRFVFAPRLTRGGYKHVVHYLSVADDLSYPAKVFHNQMIRPLVGVSDKYIYARFAFCVFELLRGFLTQRPRRLATRELATNKFGIGIWVTKVSMGQMKTAGQRDARLNARKRTIDDVECQETDLAEPRADKWPVFHQEQTAALQSVTNMHPSISRQSLIEQHSVPSQRAKKRWVWKGRQSSALESPANTHPATLEQGLNGQRSVSSQRVALHFVPTTDPDIPEQLVTGQHSGRSEMGDEQPAIEQEQMRAPQFVPVTQSAVPGQVVAGQNSIVRKLAQKQWPMQQEQVLTHTPEQVVTTQHDAIPQRETPHPTGLAGTFLTGMPAETRRRLRESRVGTMARTQTHSSDASARPQLSFPHANRPASTR